MSVPLKHQEYYFSVFATWPWEKLRISTCVYFLKHHFVLFLYPYFKYPNQILTNTVLVRVVSFK